MGTGEIHSQFAGQRDMATDKANTKIHMLVVRLLIASDCSCVQYTLAYVHLTCNITKKL